MNRPAACLGFVFAFGLLACSSEPAVRVASQANGIRCATVRDRIPASEAEPILLFHCAQSTLETGGRYFRITGRSSAGVVSNSRQSFTTATVPEASVCFEADSGPASEPAVYDSRLVVLQTDPTLRSRLSAPARQRLEAIEGSAPR